MGFLRVEDYYDFINDDHLNTILEQSTGVSGDENVLEGAELKSITRAKEYLTSRFKVDRIFKEFIDFDITTEYGYGDRINFSYDVWESSVYLSGEFVNYGGNVYQKNATTIGYTAATLPTNATFFDNRGEAGIYYIPFPAEYDEDKVYVEDDLITYSHEVYVKNDSTYTATQLPILPTNTLYFTRVRTVEYLDYETVVGVYPSNAAWTFGDNRNQSIVECVIHMVLNKVHSIINPRNIPQLRRDNFHASIEMLKEYQKGEVQVDMPDRQLTANAGFSIRFGSNESTNHSY
jgi:hypothetical protein